LEKPNGLSFLRFIRTRFKANSVFSEIERIQRYFGFSQKSDTKPTVLGAMFQDQWYVPQGESWAALFLKDAQADYLWRDTKVLEVHPCL
jgi:iron complex transport system substrate-binding protein